MTTSLFDIHHDYPDIIGDKVELRFIQEKRNYYLSLKRPMTVEENKEFDRFSMILQLQKELNNHRKRKQRLINKGILII